MVVSRLVKRVSDSITIVDATENIFIADSGCDQTLVTSIWSVLKFTSRYVLMLTAFQGRNPGQRLQVVNAAVKLTDAKV